MPRGRVPSSGPFRARRLRGRILAAWRQILPGPRMPGVRHHRPAGDRGPSQAGICRSPASTGIRYGGRRDRLRSAHAQTGVLRRSAMLQIAGRGPARPRIGGRGPVLAAARTRTLRTAAPASGRLARSGLAGPDSARPLRGDCLGPALGRTPPAQVLEPLVVGIVPEAPAAAIPLPLELIDLIPIDPVAGLLGAWLATRHRQRLCLPSGSPWFRDGLRDRGRGLGQPLSRRPLIRVGVRVRLVPPCVLPPCVLPARVLPGLGTVPFLGPGFVVRGIGRPLVLLSLRPSAAHEMSYP